MAGSPIESERGMMSSRYVILISNAEYLVGRIAEDEAAVYEHIATFYDEFDAADYIASMDKLFSPRSQRQRLEKAVKTAIYGPVQVVGPEDVAERSLSAERANESTEAADEQAGPSVSRLLGTPTVGE